MSKPITVTADTFSDVVLNSDKPVLVDFWATWCGPCTQMAPILDQFQALHDENVVVAKLDVDDFPEIAASYQITGIPAMKLFKGGKVVKDLVGTRPLPVLENELSGLI